MYRKIYVSFHLDVSLNGLNSLAFRLIRFVFFVSLSPLNNISNQHYSQFSAISCAQFPIKIRTWLNVTRFVFLWWLQRFSIGNRRLLHVRYGPFKLRLCTWLSFCVLLILHFDCVRYRWPFIIQRELWPEWIRYGTFCDRHLNWLMGESCILIRLLLKSFSSMDYRIFRHIERRISNDPPPNAQNFWKYFYWNRFWLRRIWRIENFSAFCEVFCALNNWLIHFININRNETV